jgi:ketosteroid isomerase-like protein
MMPEEPTTPDLVELRRWVEADSYDEFAAFIERYYAADAVWDMGEVGLGPFEGLPAILSALKDYWTVWEEHHHYLEDVVDLGHGVVYIVVREYGRMKGSDSHIEGRNAWVNVWDDGKVVRNTRYTDIDEAHADAERLAGERG